MRSNGERRSDDVNADASGRADGSQLSASDRLGLASHGRRRAGPGSDQGERGQSA
jgi:hypothetical protein